MKTKLLKKIRKRYSIVEFKDLPENPSYDLEFHKDKFGLPFFLLKDSFYGMYTRRYKYFKTRGESIDVILKWIKKQYKK